MKKNYRTRHFLAALLTLILGTGEIAGTGFSVLAADEETEMAEEAGAVEETGTGEEAEAVEEYMTALEAEELAKTDEPGDEEGPEEETEAAEAADAPVEKTMANTMLSNWEMAEAVAPSLDTDSWRGSYVYYGKYEGTPVKYRVLSPFNADFVPDWQTVMLLDCDEILDYVKFESDKCKEPVFQKSGLRDFLNGSGFLENDVFTQKSALTSRSAQHRRY